MGDALWHAGREREREHQARRQEHVRVDDVDVPLAEQAHEPGTEAGVEPTRVDLTTELTDLVIEGPGLARQRRELLPH